MARGTTPTRTERGAAAVEAGLVSTVLAPLLVGVLFFGNYFWHAQRVDGYDPRLRQDAVVGYGLSCQQVVDLVRNEVVTQSQTLGDASAPALGLDQVSARVVDVLPDFTVDVEVTVRIQVSSQLTSLLPNSGAVVQSATTHLENVTVSSSVCA